LNIEIYAAASSVQQLPLISIPTARSDLDIKGDRIVAMDY